MRGFVTDTHWEQESVPTLVALLLQAVVLLSM